MQDLREIINRAKDDRGLSVYRLGKMLDGKVGGRTLYDYLKRGSNTEISSKALELLFDALGLTVVPPAPTILPSGLTTAQVTVAVDYWAKQLEGLVSEPKRSQFRKHLRSRLFTHRPIALSVKVEPTGSIGSALKRARIEPSLFPEQQTSMCFENGGVQFYEMRDGMITLTLTLLPDSLPG